MCFRWIEACINEQLPPTTELEEGLRNGVFLAKLGHFIDHEVVPLKKIFDKDQNRYSVNEKIYHRQLPENVIKILIMV